MSKLTFSTSKARNKVEVAITYRNRNNRADIEHEINLLNDLTDLMAATSGIHAHGADPVVRPNYKEADGDTYISALDLAFHVNTQVESNEGEIKAYSYAGLHAALVGISDICKRHREHFLEFGVHLNLQAMRTPWVIPVDGQGVILREGSRQNEYRGNRLPRQAKLGIGAYDVTQMMVVGEPLAVKQFERAWVYLCNQYAQYIKDIPNHPDRDNGPIIDVVAMKHMWPDIRWGNLGVIVRVADALGEKHWEQLGEMHNARTHEYVLNMGNHMLATPLVYDNTKPLEGNNVFLKDCSYYSFESVI